MLRMRKGSVKKEEIVEFLKALKTHPKQALPVLWVGLKTHCSRRGRTYVDMQSGYIQIAFLPPYAPDLNVVAYLWAWLKRYALANYCLNYLGEFHPTSRYKLKRSKKCGLIIAPYWIQVILW